MILALLLIKINSIAMIINIFIGIYNNCTYIDQYTQYYFLINPLKNKIIF
jgi:hypothetical protein